MSKGLTSKGAGIFMDQPCEMKSGCVMRKLMNIVRSNRVNSCGIETPDGWCWFFARDPGIEDWCECSLSLILVPNFDDWGHSNNGAGFKLGMTLNEGISISLKGIEITYGYCLHESSCWSKYGCVRSEIMSESTDYIPESCSSFCTNWPLRTSYIWANPSCPPETNQPLLTKDTLKMAVLALPCE